MKKGDFLPLSYSFHFWERLLERSLRALSYVWGIQGLAEVFSSSQPPSSVHIPSCALCCWELGKPNAWEDWGGSHDIMIRR